jgi:hypothetical protein
MGMWVRTLASRADRAPTAAGIVIGVEGGWIEPGAAIPQVGSHRLPVTTGMMVLLAIIPR